MKIDIGENLKELKLFPKGMLIYNSEKKIQIINFQELNL